MKSFILRLFALVAVAGAFFNPRSEAAESIGAKVAPAESLSLIEIHDIPRTLARWKETAYYQVSQEPEWKAFTAKIGGLLNEVPQFEMVQSIMADISKADPAGAFFVVGELQDVNASETPKMLGGISYRGDTAHVRTMLGGVRDKLVASKTVKAETSKEGDLELEVLTVGDVAVTIAFVDKWIFAASDKKFLLEAIARYSGKSPPGLAGTEVWKNSLKKAVEEPDMTFFTNYGALGKLITQGDDTEAELFKAMAELIPETWVTSVKLDGRGMRERTFLHYKMKLPRGKGAHRSLAFTGADTYAYLEADYGGWEDVFKKLLAAIPLPEIPELEGEGLALADLITTFGPEMTVLSDWETGALALPTAFVAVEIRDTVKGRKFAELIATAMESEGKLVEKEQDGTKLWTLNVGMPIVKPTLAVNDKHLMFGLNPDSILTPLQRAKEGKQSLAQVPAFASALKSVAEPNGGMMYLDGQRLFERLYDRGRPFVANAIAGSSEVSKYLDAGLLPKSEMFTRHLTPMMVSFHVDDDGYLLESTGPATYITGTFGLGVGAALVMPAVAAFQAKGRMAEGLSNARQIHLAAMLFAADNKGNFPTKLDDLVPKYLETKKVLTSPLTPDDPEIAYETVEAKDTDKADKVWLKSKFTSRDGKRILVTVGGAVRLDVE